MRIMHWTAGFALVVSAFMGGCKKQTPKPQPPTLSVATPLKQAVTHFAYFTGRTQAVESVELRARVKGFLEQVKFKDGQRVNKGDLLFIIEQPPYEADVQKAQASIDFNTADMNNKLDDFVRVQEAFSKKVATGKELSDAKAAYLEAKANLEQAQAELKQAKINLGYTTITAPIKGKMSNRKVDPGNLVGSGEATLLATVVSEDPLYVYFNIAEQTFLRAEKAFDEGAVKRQNPDAEPLAFMGTADQENYPYRGVLDYRSNVVDPNTGTVTVRGIFKNVDGYLMPGLFAKIQLPIETKENAILIPDSAISYGQAGHYVLIVNAKGVVQQRDVNIGELYNGLREITKGLGETDKVIIKGILKARQGQPAKTEVLSIESFMKERQPDWKPPSPVATATTDPSITQTPPASQPTSHPTSQPTTVATPAKGE